METTEVLIIEDEPAAARYLGSILHGIDCDLKVVDVIDSVEDSIAWFRSHSMPDIVFMDIHLSDGDSFRIFDEVSITSPIIFTTAYDQYALDAFKVSSIDYILKPVKEEDIRRALDKWKTLTQADRSSYSDRVASMASRKRMERTFLIRFRDKLIPVESTDVAFFYTSEEKVFLYTMNGDRYQVDQTLESLSSSLPETFFRANRQFVISRSAIREITVWFGSRLQLHLTPEAPERVVISKAKVQEFKAWLSSHSHE